VQVWKEELTDGSDMYVACALELEITSQGETVELAMEHVREAIVVFFENASEAELDQWLKPLEKRKNVSMNRVHIPSGQPQNAIWA
jgi:predicted RNase H-like HicB family nuclease